MDELLDGLKYDDNGLIPAVVQDHTDGQVLMVAYMNRESLRRTLEGEHTCFWSRSRQEVHLSTLNENVQTSNIRELVQQGYGLGWLPWRTVRHLLETGELTRAGDQRWDVPLSLRLYFRQDSRHPTLPGLLTRLAAAR